ncbi:hypothetical protein GCM10023259_046090 [Thermocatellispora tengchongensis]
MLATAAAIPAAAGAANGTRPGRPRLRGFSGHRDALGILAPFGEIHCGTIQSDATRARRPRCFPRNPREIMANGEQRIGARAFSAVRRRGPGSVCTGCPPRSRRGILVFHPGLEPLLTAG